MSQKKKTLAGELLRFFTEGPGQFVPRPFESPYQWAKRLRRIQYKEYYDAMYALKKRGAVKMIKKDGKKFIELTRKGALQILLNKAAEGMEDHSSWDGKWRVYIFDIPEEAHLHRDRLRYLLKNQGFYKLQASVFINPYPLNRSALQYLKETGLNKYIRILKVEEVDDDSDLRRKFNL